MPIVLLKPCPNLGRDTTTLRRSDANSAPRTAHQANEEETAFRVQCLPGFGAQCSTTPHPTQDQIQELPNTLTFATAEIAAGLGPWLPV
jgi:hypothetical protein